MDNKLEISIDGYKLVDFEYYERVNEIYGDAGVGKTKLINDIDNVVKLYKTGQTQGIEQNIDLNNVVILHQDDINNHRYSEDTLENKIIFIDNYDRHYNADLADFVKNQHNTFFLISRKHGLEFQQLYGRNLLEYDGETYKLVNRQYNRNRYREIYWRK